MNSLKVLLWLILSICIYADVKAAEIVTSPLSDYMVETGLMRWQTAILIRGSIEKGDFEKFINVVHRLIEGLPPDPDASLLSVELDSPGGDLVEAMRIGRAVARLRLDTNFTAFNHTAFLRRDETQARVARVCNSACFFVFAGGIQRRTTTMRNTDSDLTFGLHRPRFDPSYFSGLSPEQAERKYSELVNLTRQYLEEMHVPVRIAEKILSIPSDQEYYLPLSEAKELETGSSPGFQEWLNAACGTFSRQESLDYFRLRVAPEKFGGSAGYRQYLERRIPEVRNCWSRKRAEDQRSAAKALYEAMIRDQ